MGKPKFMLGLHYGDVVLDQSEPDLLFLNYKLSFKDKIKGGVSSGPFGRARLDVVRTECAVRNLMADTGVLGLGRSIGLYRRVIRYIPMLQWKSTDEQHNRPWINPSHSLWNSLVENMDRGQREEFLAIEEEREYLNVALRNAWNSYLYLASDLPESERLNPSRLPELLDRREYSL